MIKCINLVKCPVCDKKPKLVSDELGMVYTLVCKCGKFYGNGIIEPKSTIDNPHITFETYERVCEDWQRGACKDAKKEYESCEFK